MEDLTPTFPCPDCGVTSKRVYHPIPDIWHTDGAHKTDYGRGNPANDTGDKRDRLNRKWSKFYGEDPPPPAADIPRNSENPI